MKMRFVIGLLLGALVIQGAALAGEPMDVVRGTVDDILKLLADPDLEAKPQVQRERLRKVIRAKFDFEKMTELAVGRYRRKFSEDQLRELTDLFTQLLERTYLDRIQKYEENAVSFGSERMLGPRKAQVHTEVGVGQKTFPVVYKVYRTKGGRWRVYDVKIEGVSLVSNYRKQFSEILLNKPPETLIERLQEKVHAASEKTQEKGAGR